MQDTLTYLLSSSSLEFFLGWYFFDKFLWRQRAQSCHTFLSVFPKSTVYKQVVHHSHYITLTLPTWTCQTIIHYTFQSSIVLFAAATTMSPFLSSGHKSSPQEYACRTSHQKQNMLFLCSHCPCFDSGCMLVARDECSVRRRSQNEIYCTMSCVRMKEITCSGWIGIKTMTAFQCPSLDMATVVLLDRLQYNRFVLSGPRHTQLCWFSAWWLLCQQNIICIMFCIWVHIVYLCFQDPLNT